MDVTTALSRWHQAAESADPALLPALIAEGAAFRSPAMFRPQEGRDAVVGYLTAAFRVLGEHLSYQREWLGADSAVLEFTSQVGGREIHGIDMITWDEAGLIREFTVMIRPQSSLTTVIEAMGVELQRLLG